MDSNGFIPRAPARGNITAIRPKTWNAIADVVNGGRVAAGGAIPSGVNADGMGRGWVWIKNNSGSDRSRFDCMSLGDPTMAMTTDGQVDVVFAATTADPAKSPAILLEPIANGRVGRAVIYGLCLAKVAAGSTSLLSGVPEASSHSLAPSGSGSIKLLTAPSASVVTVVPVVIGAASSSSGSGHARTPPGGVPPKAGLQMGSAIGKEMECDNDGLLAVTTTDIQLFNPSTGSVNGSTDIVYSINKAGLAVIVVEDCALGNCSDPLPVVTSTGPFTRASGVAASPIVFSATGVVLSWGTSGTIPPGMVRSGTGSSGSLIGTPTTPGTYSVVITASNCAGSASATISITIT